MQKASSVFSKKSTETLNPRRAFGSKKAVFDEPKKVDFKKPKTPLEKLQEYANGLVAKITSNTFKVEVVQNHDHIDPVEVTLNHSLKDVGAIEALINSLNKSTKEGVVASLAVVASTKRLEQSVKGLSEVGSRIQGEDLLVAVDELKEAVSLLPKFDGDYLETLEATLKKAVAGIKIPKQPEVSVTPIVEAINLLAIQLKALEKDDRVEEVEKEEPDCVGYNKKLDRDGNVREITFTYSDGSKKTMKATTDGYAIS